jgi:hypothetical protein
VAGAFSAGNPEQFVARAVWSGAKEELRRWRKRRATHPGAAS